MAPPIEEKIAKRQVKMDSSSGNFSLGAFEAKAKYGSASVGASDNTNNSEIGSADGATVVM